MPVVMVQNNQPGPTVIADGYDRSKEVEFAGKGDQSGGDIQPISESMQNLPSFTRAVRNGVFSVVEDAKQIAAAEEAQKREWDKRSGSMHEIASEFIEETVDRDFIAVPCVGPSSRGGGIPCGEDVTVRDREKTDNAPLCPQHAHLGSQYTASTDFVDGRPVVKWSRVLMGARQRQQY